MKLWQWWRTRTRAARWRRRLRRIWPELVERRVIRRYQRVRRRILRQQRRGY